MFRALVSALLLVFAVVTLVAQQPDPPPRHDKYRDDPHAYCLAGPPLPNDKSGHQCACKLICEEPTTSRPIAEDAACEMYCSKARCVCHADAAGCNPPAG